MAANRKNAKRSRRKQRSNAPELVRWATLASLALGAIGVALALYATNTTIQIETLGLVEGSGCSINNVINCDVAHGSSYAMMAGIPVAWWGFLFYLYAVLAIGYAAFGKNKETGAALAASVWVLSIGAVLFSVYKAFHLYDLGVLCLVCVAMYGVNFGLFVLIPAMFNISFGKIGSFFSNYLGGLRGESEALGFSPKMPLVSIFAGVIFFTGFILMYRYAEANFPTEDIDVDRYVEAHFRQPQVDIELPSDAIAWGNPEAELEIIEFGDFQCPACRDAAFGLRPALFEHHQDVQLHYLHFPLDSAVNDSMAANNFQLHPLAGLSARAAVCAQNEGDFWEYHDDIFRSQTTISRRMLLELAEDRGWDTGDFAACLESPESLARVKGDLQRGWQVNVGSTPTLFINGRRVSQWRSKEVVKAIVEAELARM